MSVEYTPRRAGPYESDGETLAFTFDFRVFTETDVTAVRSESTNPDAKDVELIYGTDYTVALNADQEAAPGGTVTLLQPLPSGIRLAITSSVPATQTITLTNYDGFQPTILNTAHDKATILIQQLEERVDRTLVVPSSSSETPDDVMQRLLNAQEDAQAAADAAEASAQAAEQSKEEAAEILEQVQDASDNADKILPYADDLATVADNIDSVQATGGSITNVNIVAGDLDSETYSADTDYGDYDDNLGSGEVEIPTGGNIVTVAQNIDAVQKVGQNMDSILAIEDKIDGLDQTVAEMEAAVTAAETAEAGAESAASQASQSATNAANQVTIAKDWAIKLDGKVQENGVEVDFSAKYWAQQAKGSSDAASAALDDVNDAKTEALDEISTAQTTAVSAVNTAGTTQVGNVNTAGQTQSEAVAAEGSRQVSSVQGAGSTQVNAVNDAGTAQISAVAAEGAKQVGLVGATGDDAVAEVNAAGTAQVNAVNQAGATQTANAKAQADAASQSAAEALQSKKEAVAAQSGAETARDAAVTAQGAAETANTNAQAAKTNAQASATTATNKATEASGYATTASNAKTAAETARDEAVEAKEAAEKIAGDMGDPLGKDEAEQTYRKIADSYSKTEVDTALNNKLGKNEKAESAKIADSVDWSNVSGTPAAFPPSTHTHEISGVNGLQLALDGKQPKGSYAAASHTHTASQVTDLGALGTKNEITAAELAATIDYGEYADA